MILIIDNYDSFTYNLYQEVAEIAKGEAVEVIRNNKINLDEIVNKNPRGIILSPGPGKPEDSKICLDILTHLKDKFPILGVCLGHQAIGIVFGGKVVRAEHQMHGKESFIFHNRENLFNNLESPIKVGRYHSLIIQKDTIPDCLSIEATDSLGEIMAVRHKQYNIYGVQFHPESILTPDGKQILQNFLEVCK